MMKPYLLEPEWVLHMAVAPTAHVEAGSVVGTVIGSDMDGMRERELGMAQAWHYPTERTILLWECFFHLPWRTHPLAQDANMLTLWRAFEQILCQCFPDAVRIATPPYDRIAKSHEEYEAFLSTLGYAPMTERAWGKTLTD